MGRIIRLFLLLFVLVPAVASAQLIEGRDVWKSRPLEVTLGTGFMPFYPEQFQSGYSVYGEYGFLENNTQVTNTLSLPSLNASVQYKFSRAFSAGVIMSYSSQSFINARTYDGVAINDELQHHFSVIPTLRVDWLNLRYVNLYSALSLGIAYHSAKDRVGGTKGSMLWPAGGVTYLGAKIGGKIYGYADLSVASYGVLNVGVGYRFDYNKK